MNTSQAQIVLHVRKFFEEEKLKQRSLHLNKRLERIAAAKEFSRIIVASIKTRKDADERCATAVIQFRLTKTHLCLKLTQL